MKPLRRFLLRERAHPTVALASLGLTQFCGRSRLVVSACGKQEVFVELFVVKGAEVSQAGMSVLGVVPNLNPFEDGTGELD